MSRPAGFHLSEETKRKISESNKGKKVSEETCRCISIAQRNRPPITEETRRKLSEAHKGFKQSKHHKAQLFKAHWKGGKRSYLSNIARRVIDECGVPKICGMRGDGIRMHICKKNEDTFAVHHINEDHRDSRPENLMWVHRSCHTSITWMGRSHTEEARKKMATADRSYLGSPERRELARVLALKRERDHWGRFI